MSFAHRGHELSLTIRELLREDAAQLDRAYAGGRADALFARAEEACDRAYRLGDREAEFAVQDVLHEIYTTDVVMPMGRPSAEGAWVLTGLRNRIESAFLASEERALPAGLIAQAPPHPDAYRPWLHALIHAHPAYTHPLYNEYLRDRATYEDLKYFLTQESAIDASTDDFLALLQVGAGGSMKMEIAANYWDEMGNGAPERCHALLFLQACAAVGADVVQGSVDLETESLVCGNLQVMCSLRRRYFHLGIGYFLVTEYMAPGRFKGLMQAWRRNGLVETGAGYHEVHIPLDVEHSNRWFTHVVAPAIAADPAAIPDITRGALYRLNTSQRYLDGLLPRFPSLAGHDRQAAATVATR